MRLKGKWQRSSLGHRRDLCELRRIKRRQEGEEVREYDQPTDSFLVAGKEERGVLADTEGASLFPLCGHLLGSAFRPNDLKLWFP